MKIGNHIAYFYEKIVYRVFYAIKFLFNKHILPELFKLRIITGKI